MVIKTVTVTRFPVTCAAKAACCCCRRGSACRYDCLCSLVHSAINNFVIYTQTFRPMYEYVPCSGFKENCPDFKLTVDHIAQAIQTGISSIQILNTKSRIN